MRQKKIWRYYCEFCKKSGCGKPQMRTHETHCTMNPDRICRVCGNVLKIEQPEMRWLKALMPDPTDPIYQKGSDGKFAGLGAFVSYSSTDDGAGKRLLKASIERAIEDIRKMTENDYHDGCPACILAAIRQTQPEWWWLEFNYQEEMKEAFAAIHETEEQAEMRSMY